jgi:hypothetical protein
MHYFLLDRANAYRPRQSRDPRARDGQRLVYTSPRLGDAERTATILILIVTKLEEMPSFLDRCWVLFWAIFEDATLGLLGAFCL